MTLSTLKSLRMAIASASVLVLMGCSIGPARQDMVLDPLPDAKVWPNPPDQARLAYAGLLTGERDFIAPDDQQVKPFTSPLAWALGIVIGDPEYLSLERPVSGMVDELGRILVVDASRKAVVVFDRAAHTVVDWKYININDEQETTFKSPVAITGDSQGNFYVTDSELGAVVKLNRDGKPIMRFGGDVLTRPTGITFDPIRNIIFVSDTRKHKIVGFDTAGNLIDILGEHGIRFGALNTPTHLANLDGRMLVADTNNFRIQVLDENNEFLLEFGKIGRYVGNMTRPKGVAIGGGGRIYVVESYNDHLLIFDKDGQFLLPIGGTGRKIGQFYLPNGVWTDADGRVYVADMFNGRVVVFKELDFSGGGS